MLSELLCPYTYNGDPHLLKVLQEARVCLDPRLLISKAPTGPLAAVLEALSKRRVKVLVQELPLAWSPVIAQQLERLLNVVAKLLAHILQRGRRNQRTKQSGKV